MHIIDIYHNYHDQHHPHPHQLDQHLHFAHFRIITPVTGAMSLPLSWLNCFQDLANKRQNRQPQNSIDPINQTFYSMAPCIVKAATFTPRKPIHMEPPVSEIGFRLQRGLGGQRGGLWVGDERCPTHFLANQLVRLLVRWTSYFLLSSSSTSAY